MGYYLTRTHNATNACEYKSATSGDLWTTEKAAAQHYTDSESADQALQQAYADLPAREDYKFALESTS